MFTNSNNKPTLGIFSLSSCGGCQEQILNTDTLLLDLADQVEIVYWPKIMESEFPKKLDIAIVEGAINGVELANLLSKIREVSDKVIALGMCACELNWRDDEKKYKGLSTLVDVDFKVRCCPIDALDFIKVVQHAIYGNNTFESTASLCGKCKMNEIECVLDYGRLCSGLVTQVSCDAICTKLGATCYGCGGISVNAQLETAQRVFDATQKNSTLDDFLEGCNVDRLLDQNLEGLDIEMSTFVKSRKCGRHSHRNVVAHLREHEKLKSLDVCCKVEAIRDALLEIECAKNYLSELYFEDLRKASSYDNFYDFCRDCPELLKAFLETRLILNSALTEISGRAVHPITLKVAGFTTEVTDRLLFEVREDLKTTLDFAIATVDLANSLWEKTDAPLKTPAMDIVLANWDDMCEDARFAAAKAGLRAPEDDSRRECVAKAVASINCIQIAIDKLS